MKEEARSPFATISHPNVSVSPGTPPIGSSLRRRTIFPDVKLETLPPNPCWFPPPWMSANRQFRKAGHPVVPPREVSPTREVVEAVGQALVTRTLHCIQQLERTQATNLVEINPLDMIYHREFGVSFLTEFSTAFPDLHFSAIANISNGEIVAHSVGDGKWLLSQRCPRPQKNEFTGVPALDKWLLVNRVVWCLETMGGQADLEHLSREYGVRLDSHFPTDCISIFGSAVWITLFEKEADGKISILKGPPFLFRLAGKLTEPPSVPHDERRSRPVPYPCRANQSSLSPENVKDNIAKILVDRTAHCLRDLNGVADMPTLNRAYQTLYGISFADDWLFVGDHHYAYIIILSEGEISCDKEDKEWVFGLKNRLEKRAPVEVFQEKMQKEQEMPDIEKLGDGPVPSPPPVTEAPSLQKNPEDTLEIAKAMITRTVECLTQLEAKPGELFGFYALNTIYEQKYGTPFVSAFWTAFPGCRFSEMDDLSGGKVHFESDKGLVKFGLTELVRRMTDSATLPSCATEADREQKSKQETDSVTKADERDWGPIRFPKRLQKDSSASKAPMLPLSPRYGSFDGASQDALFLSRTTRLDENFTEMVMRTVHCLRKSAGFRLNEREMRAVYKDIFGLDFESDWATAFTGPLVAEKREYFDNQIEMHKSPAGMVTYDLKKAYCFTAKDPSSRRSREETDGGGCGNGLQNGSSKRRRAPAGEDAPRKRGRRD